MTCVGFDLDLWTALVDGNLAKAAGHLDNMGEKLKSKSSQRKFV